MSEPTIPDNWKLYLVTISKEGYVLAESEKEALKLCYEIVRTEDYEDREARTDGKCWNWDNGCLVYTQEDIGEVTAKMANEHMEKVRGKTNE